MTRLDAARFLAERDRFLLLTHRRPDGDTVGSAAALCRGLRRMGKAAWVLENPEVTALYRPLLEGLTKPGPEEGDTVVTVDVAAENMLPDPFRPLADRVALRLDHHASPVPLGKEELVDPEAGACGEIVYDILERMGVELDKPMAEALYTAAATDTGGFRYANTTAHTFQVAAACAQAGGDLYGVNQAVFENNSFAKLRIQGWAVEHTRFFDGGRIAVCPIPRAVERSIGVTEDDMENISGLARSIQGVCMAATLREQDDGKIKVSVRSMPGYDAAAVCAKFGGGGHKGAAGATLDMPLEAAAQALAEAMLEA